ncbi:acyl carrier protein [Nonomuraea guangzhouensis]|uniref:Acyl carrier protein n=1 Tax=Nonomuraea guangzhouensis TaxID=1291555 RepID=A0ABW4FZ25_9ACTN|nr:acyl carrier protein [Nonomuraea guangzhouensis]
MRQADDVIGELVAFVSAAVGRRLAEEDDYFELGLADSLFALELVTFIEHRFGFTIEVEDLDLDNFRTVSRLSGFVARKCGAR